MLCAFLIGAKVSGEPTVSKSPPRFYSYQIDGSIFRMEFLTSVRMEAYGVPRLWCICAWYTPDLLIGKVKFK